MLRHGEKKNYLRRVSEPVEGRGKRTLSGRVKVAVFLKIGIRSEGSDGVGGGGSIVQVRMMTCQRGKRFCRREWSCASC